MQTGSDATREPKSKRRNSGCLIFVVVYGLSLIVLYFASTPTHTDDFSGRTAHEFTIAGVATNNANDDYRYRVINLERLNAGNLDLSDITFLLPQESISIYVGDIHDAEILEDHGDWQLVAFYYSNTRTSTSIYRAYPNRIEPVSYRVTSSVGHFFGALFLLAPALVLSMLIAALLNWRARRASQDPRL